MRLSSVCGLLGDRAKQYPYREQRLTRELYNHSICIYKENIEEKVKCRPRGMIPKYRFLWRVWPMVRDEEISHGAYSLCDFTITTQCLSFKNFRGRSRDDFWLDQQRDVVVVLWAWRTLLAGGLSPKTGMVYTSSVAPRFHLERFCHKFWALALKG